MQYDCICNVYMDRVQHEQINYDVFVVYYVNDKEKREEIWRRRMTNIPELQTMHRWNDTKSLQIRSITQLLRTGLGRSAGASAVIQVVNLIRNNLQLSVNSKKIQILYSITMYFVTLQYTIKQYVWFE